tara:strand:- start:8618 stop:8869 length:252 start_codon:yes stop_codon:yes gene_type:complete
MHEALYIATALLTGSILLSLGILLGFYLARATYREVTNPPYEELLKLHREDTQTNEDPDGYDWDEYNSVLTPPLGDDGSEPKA